MTQDIGDLFRWGPLLEQAVLVLRLGDRPSARPKMRPVERVRNVAKGKRFVAFLATSHAAATFVDNGLSP
jgi:hypothetical protein